MRINPPLANSPVHRLVVPNEWHCWCHWHQFPFQTRELLLDLNCLLLCKQWNWMGHHSHLLTSIQHWHTRRVRELSHQNTSARHCTSVQRPPDQQHLATTHQQKLKQTTNTCFHPRPHNSPASLHVRIFYISLHAATHSSHSPDDGWSTLPETSSPLLPFLERFQFFSETLERIL